MFGELVKAAGSREAAEFDVDADNASPADRDLFEHLSGAARGWREAAGRSTRVDEHDDAGQGDADPVSLSIS